MRRETKDTLSKPIAVPDMNYQFRKLADLAPYPKNSRIHSLKQIHELDKAIGLYGFTNPILVDADGIVAGHGRIEAVKQRYARGDLVRLPNGEAIPTDTIPTLDCSGWSEQQRRAYIIFDNKSALNATWDEDILASELLALSQTDFDMDLTGFNADELSDLISDGEDGGLTDENSTPEVPTNPVTVSGDVWLLGEHRVMCGDSTITESVEKLMDGTKADMVFTDPPYGVSFQSNMSKGGTATRFDVIANDDKIMNIAPVVWQFMKNDSAAFIWTSHHVYQEWRDQFEKFYKQTIIWYKHGGGIGDLEGAYACDYEMAIFCVKGRPKFRGKRGMAVWDIRKDSASTYIHPTQKPVELSESAINDFSDKNNNILDLFGGSGSTLIGCEKTDRNAYVMELDQKYCDVIINRWQKYTGLEATLEADSKPFSKVARQRAKLPKAA